MNYSSRCISGSVGVQRLITIDGQSLDGFLHTALQLLKITVYSAPLRGRLHKGVDLLLVPTMLPYNCLPFRDPLGPHVLSHQT